MPAAVGHTYTSTRAVQPPVYRGDQKALGAGGAVQGVFQVQPREVAPGPRCLLTGWHKGMEDSRVLRNGAVCSAGPETWQ